MRKKRSRTGIGLIVIGILCCLGAAALAGYNMADSKRAGKASEEILALLVEEIQNPPDPEETEENGSSVQGRVRYHRLDIPLDPRAEIPEMATILIDGYEYIGMIAIPSLENLELPVMKDWDYDRLKISPCLYTGSYYTNDMVICAHNYDEHFGPLLNDLQLGADVYFVTTGGERIHFVVINKEVVAPTDIEVMIENSRNQEDSEHEWDLTLFTCNYGGQTRCAVRCTRIKEPAGEEN